jgi:BirA family biotin operon repressor/biotin-[acetyl-CoA-carboxylase] ligase
MREDAQILATLRAASPGLASGSDLAHQLGISRAAVWARIEALRELGYEIDASPHRGYRLISTPDVLHADDLLSRLGGRQIVGRDVQVFKETTSTNDVAERLAWDGVGEGVVVFAETQTKGRGRLGRRWVATHGRGLLFSVLLRPDLAPQGVTQVMVAAGTAVARAIRRSTKLNPQIKWPNDILIGSKKVAGILTEMQAELDRVKYVCLGIGVNVNQNAGDFAPELRRMATSLKIESGQAQKRSDLAIAILQELDADYGRIRAGQFAAVADEWESQCATLGRQVRIVQGSRIVEGQAESLDNEGGLLVRTEYGRLERIISGDVPLT